MTFVKRVSVSGNLLSNFVFKSEEAMCHWLETEFPKLVESYGKLEYSIDDLDGLAVGDSCHVAGEGDDVFKIVGLVKYNDHRYGFVLNSGWSEEVAKCFRAVSQDRESTSDEHELIIRGFKTKAQLDAFVDHCKSQEELCDSIWFECRKCKDKLEFFPL